MFSSNCNLRLSRLFPILICFCLITSTSSPNSVTLPKDDIHQSFDMYEIPCSVVAVYAVMTAKGEDVRFADIMQDMDGYSRKKHSLTEIKDELEKLGITATAVKLSYNELLRISRKKTAYFILTIAKNDSDEFHCITTLNCHGDNLVIFDYPLLARQVTREKFEKVMRGSALMVPRNAEMKSLAGNAYTLKMIFITITILALAGYLYGTFRKLFKSRL